MPAGPRCSDRNARLVAFGLIEPWPNKFEDQLDSANAADRPDELRKSAPGVLQDVWSSHRACTTDCGVESSKHGWNAALERGLRYPRLERAVPGAARDVQASGRRAVATVEAGRPRELMFGSAVGT